MVETSDSLINAQTQAFYAALESYEKALEVDPDNAEFHFHRATLLYGLTRYDEALIGFNRALELNPNYAEAYANRGLALRSLKHFSEALANYDQAIALQSDYANAYYNRGNLLMDMGRFEEALVSFSHFIQLKPENIQGYLNRIIIYGKLERFEEGLIECEEAIKLQPDFSSYTARGLLLKEIKQFDQALIDFDRAIILSPANSNGYINRAIVLRMLNRLDEALSDCEKSVVLCPDNAEHYFTYGITLRAAGRFDEALACYAKALMLNENHEKVSWNEGLLRLLMGDFEKGWPLYELRWKESVWQENNNLIPGENNITLSRESNQPLWLGAEDLEGKTILLRYEQGFGDNIQFCRYVNLVVGLGARVILETRPVLEGLMRSLKGQPELVMLDQPLPSYDYYCPVMSLPLAFKTRLENVPAEIPYLWAGPEKIKQWSERAGEKLKPRIGLVWSGNSLHGEDQICSLPLADLLKIMPENLQLVILQKEIRDADQLTLREYSEVLSFENEIKDFSDTAALIAQMDLVISVDTSVAHLAGALGKSVWILLPKIPDWRWLLDREDSPWYPTARLFRQTQRGDWDSVLMKVQEQLKGCFGI